MSRKTLKFNTETLRRLSVRESRQVAGGQDLEGGVGTFIESSGLTSCGTCDTTCSGCGATADCPIYG